MRFDQRTVDDSYRSGAGDFSAMLPGTISGELPKHAREVRGVAKAYHLGNMFECVTLVTK
jgi:hypothetical protein